jgi:tetratricopeptide (TPR) repeat protein
MQIQPRNSRLHEMRAQVLDQAGRTFEAVQAAQQAVSLEPDWVEGHITLARVQLNLGEPQLALASYMAAAKLQPGHPDLVQEMPNAQMLAKMHQQQPKGTRAHVVEGSSDAAAAAAAAAAGAEAIVQEEVEAAEAGGTGDEHMSATAVAAAAVPNSDAQAAAAAEPAGAAAAVTEGAAAADALVQGSSAQQAHEGTQQPSAAAGADQHSSEAS